MSFLCCLAKCCLTFRRKVSRLRQSLPNCLEREFLITVTQRLVPRRMCTPIRVRPYSGICTGSQFPEPQRRREIEVLRFSCVLGTSRCTSHNPGSSPVAAFAIVSNSLLAVRPSDAKPAGMAPAGFSAAKTTMSVAKKEARSAPENLQRVR